MVRRLALLSTAAITGALAQGNNEPTSVVTLILPSLASQSLHASFNGILSAATTYVIGCPSSIKQEDCMVPDMTVFEGPSTVGWALNLVSEVAYVDCKVTSNTGLCTQTVGSEIGTTTIPDIDQFATAVTITAGLEKLAPETGISTTITNMPTGDNKPTPTADKTPEGSKTTPSSSQSTGGVPRNTQQALLAGVAALAGGAILL